jgi:putative oxidoreductase
MSLTIFAEGFCAMLIVVGLCTRWASAVGAFTMIVAAFVIHGDDPLKKQELALMYLSVYGALIALGPGRLSIDYLLGRDR